MPGLVLGLEPGPEPGPGGPPDWWWQWFSVPLEGLIARMPSAQQIINADGKTPAEASAANASVAVKRALGVRQ